MTADIIRATALLGLVGEPSTTKKYNPVKEVPCDECVLVRLERRGDAPAPAPARLKRKSASRELRLCYAHAHLWRVLEGRRIA